MIVPVATLFAQVAGRMLPAQMAASIVARAVPIIFVVVPLPVNGMFPPVMVMMAPLPVIVVSTRRRAIPMRFSRSVVKM